MRLPDEIQALAMRQHGVVTRRQLIDAGISAATIRWGVATGWRCVLPGVIVLSPGIPTHDQRLTAALLKAGPQSWLAGSTALVWHRFPGFETALPVNVLVPASVGVVSTGWLKVRRTVIVGERLVERGPVRVSCLPRAVVDAAAEASHDAAAISLVITAVQERLVRLDDVAHWVAIRRRNGRSRLDRAVSAAASGAWSVPESQLLTLIERSRVLPEVWANPRLVDEGGRPLTTPDAWVDDVALAVMVHSRRFHGGELDWEATVGADEDLRSAGVYVVAVTPREISGDPARVLSRLRQAYERASERPRPEVSATRRPAYSAAG